jgi:hypothetical protein
MSLAVGSVDFPALAGGITPVKLDFASNPNHYRAVGNGKVKKIKPRRVSPGDLAPRPKLSLNVQCDVAEEQDAEMEWWFRAMR